MRCGQYFVLSLLQITVLLISCSKAISSDFWSRLSTTIDSFQANVIVNRSDVTFYYYNLQKRNDPVVLNLGDFNGTVSDDYDPSLRTYFIAHGSGDSYKGLISIKNAILDSYDSHDSNVTSADVGSVANVFLIDYSHHADLFYTILVTCVPKLTYIMGEAVDKVLRIHHVPPANVVLIGHSVGAHVVGGIGAHLNGAAEYIIGMDPAAPLFQNEAREKRLDLSDARFVQVVHTNGGFQGTLKSVGHADFYPNGGGMDQPGCGFDIFGACAHARATAYYRESLRSGGRRFVGRLCSSYESFKNGDCDANRTSYFGGMTIDTSARGNFYFDTNAESPYATGKC